VRLEAVGRHGWPLHLKGRIPGLRRQLASQRRAAFRDSEGSCFWIDSVDQGQHGRQASMDGPWQHHPAE
jgi:hypothetical protein